MSTTAEQIAQMQRQIDALKTRALQPIGDLAEFSAVQLRAEPIYEALGDHSPRPLAGECLIPFWQRTLEGLQRFSARWAKIPLGGIKDPSTLSAIEQDIFHDATREASNPTHFRKGEVRAIVKMDGSGRPVTRYIGDSDAVWNQFNAPFKCAKNGLDSFLTRGAR